MSRHDYAHAPTHGLETLCPSHPLYGEAWDLAVRMTFPGEARNVIDYPDDSIGVRLGGSYFLLRPLYVPEHFASRTELDSAAFSHSS